jgi:DNA topoisomerase-1
VYLKVGRFGPYVQRGVAGEGAKPQNASLLKGMQPQDIDLATALKLLSLPRELGLHPDTGAALAGRPVVAYNGRFGPYIKCDSETRSLPAGLSPLDVTLEQAVALLAQPKALRRGFRQAREPLAVLGGSPVTQQKVQLFEGRYGPYVSDGVTNASVPKDVEPAQLTLDEAVSLLAARAARQGEEPRRPRRTARRAPSKTTAPRGTRKKAVVKAPRAKKNDRKKAPAARKPAQRRPKAEQSLA